MKLYLLLLNILFASTSFAFESYHKYNNKYIVTTDCNTMYVCNSLGDMTIAIPCPPRDSDGWMLPCEITVTTFYNCVQQNGNTFHSIKSFYSPYIFYEDSKNPFTECKNSPNYHTANIKISDCRTSYKKKKILIWVTKSSPITLKVDLSIISLQMVFMIEFLLVLVGANTITLVVDAVLLTD